MRRATPDSEAIASSEDDAPWPNATSFGTSLRKDNGVPGFGGIWSQKRGSFGMEQKTARGSFRDAARLGGAGASSAAGLRAGSTPSPSPSDTSSAMPSVIPLQPTPKLGRSMSHSQGQRDPVHAGKSQRRHRPSALPLGLLPEEDLDTRDLDTDTEADTEPEDELGGNLTHTISHPLMRGSLHRTVTLPATYAPRHGHADRDPRGRSSNGAALHDPASGLALDHPQRRSQWSTIGWDDVSHVNESRRHSLAEIPTRRGSVVGAEHRPATGGAAFLPDPFMAEWAGNQMHSDRAFREDLRLSLSTAARNENSSAHISLDSPSDPRYTPTIEPGGLLHDVPSMYKVPHISIAEHERGEPDLRGAPGMASWGSAPHRARRLLFVVSFKCSRADVFYLLDNTGLSITEGDMVIVEADRGQDLGTVQHAHVTPDDARVYKRKYGEEQYKWLMMFSRHNQRGSVNPNAQLYGDKPAPPALQPMLPRDNAHSLKPKAIKRLAADHEIRMLAEKEGNEAKAKRTCQQKVAHLRLDMEILDAEWQWDFQKLILYYYADHYINFKDLITELYRIYKTRIWLSAINPASFSQHALGQPPSGIGPGALSANPTPTAPAALHSPPPATSSTDPLGSTSPSSSSSYPPPDPDPFGAVRPYNIEYNTYTPNYPRIPGVANSFPPPATGPYPPAPSYGHAGPTDLASPDYPSYDRPAAVRPMSSFDASSPAPDAYHAHRGGSSGTAGYASASPRFTRAPPAPAARGADGGFAAFAAQMHGLAPQYVSPQWPAPQPQYASQQWPSPSPSPLPLPLPLSQLYASAFQHQHQQSLYAHPPLHRYHAPPPLHASQRQHSPRQQPSPHRLLFAPQSQSQSQAQQQQHRQQHHQQHQPPYQQQQQSQQQQLHAAVCAPPDLPSLVSDMHLGRRPGRGGAG